MCTTHLSKKFRIIKLIVYFHNLKEYLFPDLIVFRGHWGLGMGVVVAEKLVIFFALRGKVLGNATCLYCVEDKTSRLH